MVVVFSYSMSKCSKRTWSGFLCIWRLHYSMQFYLSQEVDVSKSEMSAPAGVAFCFSKCLLLNFWFFPVIPIEGIKKNQIRAQYIPQQWVFSRIGSALSLPHTGPYSSKAHCFGLSPTHNLCFLSESILYSYVHQSLVADEVSWGGSHHPVISGNVTETPDADVGIMVLHKNFSW